MPVYKDKERGTWYFEFRKVINGETYRRKVRGFPNKTVATAAMHEEIRKLSNPELKLTNETITLDELYIEYREYRKTKVKITSLERQDARYKNHVSNDLGFHKVKSLTPQIVASWRTNLINKDFSETFTNQTIREFKSLISYAIKKGYLKDNRLVDELEPASMNKIVPERNVWTLNEIDEFLSSFDLTIEKEKDMYEYFYAFSKTGMRPNEFRALQAKDLQGNYLVVNKNITSKIAGGDLIQTPKNKTSNRKVLIPDEVAQMLSNRIKDYKPNDFIFGKEKAYRETNLNRSLAQHIKAANLKPIVLYGFRHSHATNLIRAGVPIKVVSRRLGHKDASTTMNVYWHLFSEDEELALKVIK
jgi:integrase